MRIATMIIALGLMLIVGFQSCAASFGGSMGHDQAMSGAASVGFLVVFLLLIGAAFAIPFPIVSIVCFVLAGIMAITAGFSSKFSDLGIWGFVMLILAAMSFFGFREKRKKGVEQQRVM